MARSDFYAKVPNDLSRAWARLRMTAAECAITWALVPRTLGSYDPTRKRVGRRDVRVSVRELADDTGYSVTATHQALRRLESRGVLTIIDAGKGRRPMRLALCTNAAILTCPVLDRGTAEDTVLVGADVAESIEDPTLRALARGFVSNAACTQSADSPCVQPSLDTSDRSVQPPLDSGVQPPLDTTSLPETSCKTETARGAASEDAPRALPEGAQ